MKTGPLALSNLRVLVLDEGDEMLQMGFVDAIEWILEQSPKERQIALFSATLPAAIRRIAQKHMRKPTEITINNRGGNAPKIRQRYWLVSGVHKLDALTRLLEAERFEAMLVFVRTKLETVELAARLEARGFGAAPLNGDIPQQQRERTVARLKGGQLDILVATDVAARGLDVDRISHVINYDIPYDSETYIHRIGRTGRAGRSGEAILFVAPRERNMLRIIERVTHARIEQMDLPSVEDVNQQRATRFKERIVAAVRSGEGNLFRPVLEQIEREHDLPAVEIAAALASLLQGSAPFLLESKAGSPPAAAPAVAKSGARLRPTRSLPASRTRALWGPGKKGPPMETYRVEVGRVHQVAPGNIVGAIANEAGLESRHIGDVEIHEDHSFVDLPQGMPKEIFQELKKVRVRGAELQHQPRGQALRW